MHPRAIAYAVLIASHVDDIGQTRGAGHGIVALLIGDYDEAIVMLAVLLILMEIRDGPAKVGSMARLAGMNRIAQSKASAIRHALQTVGEAVNTDLLPDFSQEDCEAVGSVTAAHLRPAGKRSVHAAGNVHQQDGLSWQARFACQRTEHGLLQFALPLRRITRRSDEAERQHAVGL